MNTKLVFYANYMAIGWFFDITFEKRAMKALMQGSPWIMVITGLLLVLGCAEPAAAQSHIFPIHADVPAFNEITAQTDIHTQGVYQYYSDRHPQASSSKAPTMTRPHVPG